MRGQSGRNRRRSRDIDHRSCGRFNRWSACAHSGFNDSGRGHRSGATREGNRRGRDINRTTGTARLRRPITAESAALKPKKEMPR